MRCPSARTRGGLHVEGFAGLPTLHRPNAMQLHLIVNGRPVRDKLLSAAVRAAYGDLVPSGRYPMVVLYLTLPPDEVDVNVHPAKAELRFRDAQDIRSLIDRRTCGKHWAMPATAPRPRCRKWRSAT